MPRRRPGVILRRSGGAKSRTRPYAPRTRPARNHGNVQRPRVAAVRKSRLRMTERHCIHASPSIAGKVVGVNRRFLAATGCSAHLSQDFRAGADAGLPASGQARAAATSCPIRDEPGHSLEGLATKRRMGRTRSPVLAGPTARSHPAAESCVAPLPRHNPCHSTWPLASRARSMRWRPAVPAVSAAPARAQAARTRRTSCCRSARSTRLCRAPAGTARRP